MRQRDIAKEKRSKYVFLFGTIVACWNLFCNGFIVIIFYFQCNISKRLVSDAVNKMKGKIPEIAGSHVSSRVLQVIRIFCFSSLSIVHT